MLFLVTLLIKSFVIRWIYVERMWFHTVWSDSSLVMLSCLSSLINKCLAVEVQCARLLDSDCKLQEQIPETSVRVHLIFFTALWGCN